MIRNKKRFILKKGEEVVGEASTMTEVASLLGITKGHIYNQITEEDLTFKFRKITYTIVDKLA